MQGASPGLCASPAVETPATRLPARLGCLCRVNGLLAKRTKEISEPQAPIKNPAPAWLLWRAAQSSSCSPSPPLPGWGAAASLPGRTGAAAPRASQAAAAHAAPAPLETLSAGVSGPTNPELEEPLAASPRDVLKPRLSCSAAPFRRQGGEFQETLVLPYPPALPKGTRSQLPLSCSGARQAPATFPTRS